MTKRIFALMLVLVMVFTVVGCESKDDKDAKLEEYKGMIEDFLDALTADNYDKIDKLLYSGLNDEIKPYFEQCEADYGIDYAAGYDLKKYYNAYHMDSEGEVKGTAYQYDLRVNFGEFESYVTVQILDDGDKAGIVLFEISPRLV